MGDYVSEDSYNDLATSSKLPSIFYKDVPCCDNCFKIYNLIEDKRNAALAKISNYMPFIQIYAFFPVLTPNCVFSIGRKNKEKENKSINAWNDDASSKKSTHSKLSVAARTPFESINHPKPEADDADRNLHNVRTANLPPSNCAMLYLIYFPSMYDTYWTIFSLLFRMCVAHRWYDL